MMLQDLPAVEAVVLRVHEHHVLRDAHPLNVYKSSCTIIYAKRCLFLRSVTSPLQLRSCCSEQDLASASI